MKREGRKEGIVTGIRSITDQVEKETGTMTETDEATDEGKAGDMKRAMMVLGGRRGIRSITATKGDERTGTATMRAKAAHTVTTEIKAVADTDDKGHFPDIRGADHAPLHEAITNPHGTNGVDEVLARIA